MVVWTGLALGLRLAHLEHACIEHWDEAVYANNFHARALLSGPYPAVHLYAPPLVPALIEAALGAFGTSSTVAILPVLVLGVVAVPLAWCAGRAWFGPTAGFVAAGLLATSGYHIAFSRMALTDAPLATLFVAALVLSREAIARDSWVWSALAGLAAGLAWATKYNGWLALAAIAAGYVAWGVTEAGARPSAWRRVPRVALLVAVACACWWPILRDLEPKGGSPAVAANHARYFVGLGGAGEAFLRQAAHHRHLNGGASLLGGLVFAVPLAVGTGRARLVAVLPMVVAGCAGSSAATALAAALGLAWVLRAKSTSNAGRLAAWMALAAFVGLSLATPMYTPYPRLSLLWLVAATIAASALAGVVARGHSGLEPAWVGRRGVWPVGLALVITVVAGLGARDPTASPAWQDRGARRAATLAALRVADEFTRRKLHLVPSRRDVCFAVFGAPDAFFHLAGEGRGAVPVVRLELLAAGRAHLPRGAFLLARENLDFAEQAGALAGVADRLAGFELSPSDLALLDDHDPADLALPNDRPRERVTLFWLR